MINEVVCNNILESLRIGLNKKDSAVMAGIDESTFYRWIQSDASFASQVEANILVYKRSLIQNLNIHAKKSGIINLRILEKRWPQEWLNPQIQNTGGENDIESLAELMRQLIAMPDDEIAEANISDLS